jgi:hypothetical protein
MQVSFVLVRTRKNTRALHREKQKLKQSWDSSMMTLLIYPSLTKFVQIQFSIFMKQKKIKRFGESFVMTLPLCVIIIISEGDHIFSYS